MLSLIDEVAVERALAGSLPRRLRDLLAAGHLASTASGVVDQTHYLVVRAGDTEADIMREVGFSPLVNPIDGARFDTADFHPWWDWLTEHGDWYKMIVTFGSTFACVLLIENTRGVADALLALCRQYAD